MFAAITGTATAGSLSGGRLANDRLGSARSPNLVFMSYLQVSSRRVSKRMPTRLMVPLCAALGFILPAAYALVLGIPEAIIHDEYSYLLGADTFARGRLTNPSPQFPQFFESEHILVTPSYQSKYPPAQALVLAFGQMVFGHPIWGVWLTCAIFAGSLVWMLQAWTSRQWALAATVLTILTLGTATYWAQSYWGGMLGAAGGALVFGGFRRTLVRPAVGASMLGAVGIVILANARPLEGMVATLVVGLWVALWFAQDRAHSLSAKLRTVALPVASVLVVGLIAVCGYNRAVTGHIWSSPYEVHIDQYLYRGVFIFSGPRQPERKAPERVDAFYREVAESPAAGRRELAATALRNFIWRLPHSLTAPFGVSTEPKLVRAPYYGVFVWLLLLPSIWARRSLGSFAVLAVVAAAAELVVWHFGWVYPLPLMPFVIAALFAASDGRLLRTSWWRVAAIAILCLCAVQALVMWWLPHYTSPIAAVMIAAMASAFRLQAVRLRVQTPRKLYAVVTVVALVHLAGLVVSGSAVRADRQYGMGRTRLVNELLSKADFHLVFVKYSPRYPPHFEWVYNEADLNGTPVLFAHDLGDVENNSLIDAYPNRLVWKVYVSPEVHLARYRPEDRD